MEKVLIYDFDRSLKSLGTDEKIEEVFGLKPRRFGKTKDAEALFDKVHKKVIETDEDELGVFNNEVYTNDRDIKIEVVDSITALQVDRKKEVRGTKTSVSLPQWGEIGEGIEDILIKFIRTDNHVIVLGHIKNEKDDDTGMIMSIPSLSGRMANEAGRYFDIICYTRLLEDDKGGVKFLWQILADERRMAKCRIKEIADMALKTRGLIPQDFSLLLNNSHKAIKILVIGNPGSGKSYSLRTLKKCININNQEEGK